MWNAKLKTRTPFSNTTNEEEHKSPPGKQILVSTLPTLTHSLNEIVQLFIFFFFSGTIPILLLRELSWKLPILRVPERITISVSYTFVSFIFFHQYCPVHTPPRSCLARGEMNEKNNFKISKYFYIRIARIFIMWFFYELNLIFASVRKFVYFNVSIKYRYYNVLGLFFFFSFLVFVLLWLLFSSSFID